MRFVVGSLDDQDARDWSVPGHDVVWVMEMVSRPFGIEPPIFRRRLTWFTTNRAWDLTRAK